MPEGDTLRAVAAALRPLLEGHALRAVRFRGGAERPRLVGQTVDSVTARGKHLLITAGDTTLRVHLGMNGSWHRYRPGEPWQRAAESAGLVLETDDVVCVCFQPMEVATVATRALARHDPVARLGPDLLDEAWDRAEVLRRARAPRNAKREIAPLLLDQTVAAGIGNVYKSEVCFLERVDPWRRVSTLPDEALSGLYERASDLLRANVGPGIRTTTRDPRRRDPFARRRPNLWVYRRAGRPCLRCGARIRSAAQGAPTPRTTYWCPDCQSSS